jgi:hypothetical protein
MKAYNNYRSLYSEPAHDHKGVPLWNNSDAQCLLKEDITVGKYQPRDKKQVPKILWELWLEYQVFELDVFRDHIYQERRF